MQTSWTEWPKQVPGFDMGRWRMSQPITVTGRRVFGPYAGYRGFFQTSKYWSDLPW